MSSAGLAERHGLRVQLRERPYGGIAAHVILPRDLFHDRPGPTDRNGRGAAAGSPIRTGTGPIHDRGTEAGHAAASPVGVPAASPVAGPAASTDGGSADGPETSVPASAETDEG